MNSGVLGTINQIQAVNNVPYGGLYFGQWYRNHDQTGGLWLQKATHDFDCINLLAGSRPVCVAAMGSRRVYGGDLILAENFLDLVRGRASPNASLRDGLLSAAMCLAARESARTKTFQPV